MLAHLEAALCGNIPLQLQGDIRQMFVHYAEQNYELSLTLAKKLFTQQKNSDEKSFYLHFICIIFEIKYDLKQRTLWMNKWHQLLSSAVGVYSLAAHKYHLANTCYFESHYLEAHKRYRELTENAATPLRFQSLSHFHLGLIYAQRKLQRAAMNEMKLAYTLAYQINHQKLLGRIKEQIQSLDEESDFFLLDADLCNLLKIKDIASAKKVYLQKRDLERKNKFHRQHSSLHALLPALVALSSNNLRKVLFTFELIHDPALKVQSLAFVRSLGFDSEELKAMHDHLCDDLNIAAAEVNTSRKFLGQSLNEIASEDLAKFTVFILDKNNVDKEDICRHVWNLDYDPVIHDGKIYKLIHKFRDYFGKKDLIVNRYGRYEVNQRYRA